ncbi:MAG: 4-hydroxy-3-methylbut-2-enyl diphosphate reductase [Xanthomonadales bacterium]|nr:4-hydroxy-3-methylbut-2-enyl diphosphate reductase [Gammaproteobacteria bacterium]MBT8054647.1 4-hydroxy-3-methylbut-2-enyl diphosphate reductase [Gammaproteobacteria bacterium]NND55737.1 4-hydroxy-3-methylbut-2-enyl diphosphate reductase [Xanthomonadales bacterium]NNK50148.1 4-hydroxy-3-methylbut-2-enyl diphosphate reductase [Xanthomonadales bacterium]
MNILLANPRGFCAGVDRAIEIVERALDLFGAPIYVRHEVVHNRFVVDRLARAGAIFVDELDEVPDNATVVFSAHGVSKAVRTEGGTRGLQVFDATCPLVTKVHMEVARYCKSGFDVVLIGHAGHPEVEGTLGQWLSAPPRENAIFLVEEPADVAALEVNFPEKIAYVTQTTLSVDDTQAVIGALQKKFPKIVGPKHDDICYATQNRQDAVKELARQVDLMLVVGSVNSSNSNRLRELAEKQGIRAYLIDGAEDVQEEWLSGTLAIGVTAGASAPESLVQQVIERLTQYGGISAQEISGRPENIEFALPKELRIAVKNSA